MLRERVGFVELVQILGGGFKYVFCFKPYSGK